MPACVKLRPRGLPGILAALLLAGGCDLFSTRTPDVASGNESLWQSPTSPQIIVRNLQLAFQAGNFNDYQRALTDDFVFVADPTDVTEMDLERPGENVYEAWNRDVEVTTAQDIRLPADSLTVDLVLFDEVIESTGRLLKYNYSLRIYAGGQPTTYEGEAWFQTRQESTGEWFIFHWEDIASSAALDSWGLLKGRNRPASG